MDRSAYSLIGIVVLTFTLVTLANSTDTLLESFTGDHTKLVWARAVSNTFESDIITKNYELICYDSREGKERVLVKGPISCANPWISSDGTKVIYSNWPDTIINIIDWNGLHNRELTRGFGLCLWKDPATGIEWLYYSNYAYGNRIERCDINNTTSKELVYDKKQVSIRFRLSADGKYAGGEFPWPDAGILDLSNMTFTKYGLGCNSHIAPDNSYRFFHLHADHKSVIMYDSGGINKRTIDLSSAIDCDGNTVWVPKWSNNVLFFTIAAPHANEKIMHDIFIGKFDPNFNYVKKWYRITDNGPSKFDCYAYAWIGHDSTLTISPNQLVFSVDENSSGELTQEVTITNDTAALPPLSVQSSEQWLSVHLVTKGAHKTIINKINPAENLSGITLEAFVTISGNSILTTQYKVTLRYESSRYLHSIAIDPVQAIVKCGSTVDFKALGYDQFGESAGLVDVNWKCTPAAGRIDDSGHFISGAIEGSYSLEAVAKEKSLTSTASIIVYKEITISSPAEGDTFTPGDTMHIRWKGKPPFIQGVTISISPDNGLTWLTVNKSGSVVKDGPYWGDFPWIVEDSLSSRRGKMCIFSDSCLLRIDDYVTGNYEPALTQGYFSIAPHKPHPPVNSNKLLIHRTKKGIFITADQELQSVEFVNCAGVVLRSDRIAQGHKQYFIDAKTSNGLYLARIRFDGGNTRIVKFLPFPY